MIKLKRGKKPEYLTDDVVNKLTKRNMYKKNGKIVLIVLLLKENQ